MNKFDHIAQFIHDPKVIFDVGAFNGEDFFWFAKIYPEAQIYAFEANALVPNKDRENVHFFNVVVCDKIGHVEFRASTGKHAASGSILAPTPKMFEHYPAMKFLAKVTMPSITISAFCKEHGIEKIDILHMDIQGAEYYAILGFGNYKPSVIWMETCEYENYQDAKSRDEIDGLMHSLGYRIRHRDASDTLFILRPFKIF